MSLAKATISGTITKAPEKRFTSNNVAIASFPLDFSEVEGEQNIVYVRAIGNMAQKVFEQLKKGDKVVVEGRLLMISIKSEDGQTERKVAELDISSFEKVQGANASRNGVSNNLEEKSDSVVEFAEEEFGDELLGEDEIPF
ncbi:MAG: single-stranded DNA-binding protein [Candidatus Gastranaerophilales bacterium]|nr:single-stranded DNA-binding protein [Candidatus Gastranaerophilales bacterium]